MKKSIIRYRFLIVFVGFAQMPGLFAQSEFLQTFREKWNNSMQFTLKYAELMPANAYDYQPTPQEMSFQKQLIHILQNILWLSTDYLEAEPFHNDLRTADPSKDELIALIERAFKHVDKTIATLKGHRLRDKVDFFAGEKNILQILELMDDHVTHHRAQLGVYLRLNDIKPPPYTGW